MVGVLQLKVCSDLQTYDLSLLSTAERKVGQMRYALWHADLSLGAEAHAEAATALAELYVSLGQPAAALELLYSLQGAGAVLPPQSRAIWPLHWRRASLFLKLGHTVRHLSTLHLHGTPHDDTLLLTLSVPGAKAGWALRKELLWLRCSCCLMSGIASHDIRTAIHILMQIMEHVLPDRSLVVLAAH